MRAVQLRAKRQIDDSVGSDSVEAVVTTNVEGLKRTISALRVAGRLEDVDEATIALAEGLAVAVDAEPANAALWREYRAAVSSVQQAGSGGVDDDTTAFLVSIRTPAVRPTVGDTS